MRRVLALVMVLISVMSAGCGGEPNSLFDAAGYHLRDGRVYYLNTFPGKAFDVSGADADSFEVLDGGFARDRGAVYLDGRALPDADPASFELLDRAGYAKDARQVYARDRVISSDPEHFELLGGDLSRDRAAVYWPDGSVLSDDPEHFEIISNAERYLFTRDKKRVHVNGNPIAGADPQSYRVLGEAYGTDRDGAFYFDGPIADADFASLRHLEGAYAVDVRRAYWMGKEIRGATPAGFRVLNAAFECSADGDEAFYRDGVIADVDPRSFPAGAGVTGCSATGIAFTN